MLTGLPQGSVLGRLLFLLYSNDLNLAIKHFKVHYFTVADNTNLYIYIYTNYYILYIYILYNYNYILYIYQKLNKMLNKDWKNLTNWHNANKTSVKYLKKPLDCLIKLKEKWKKTLPNFIS